MGTERVKLGYDIAGPQGAPALVLGSSLGTTRAMWDGARQALAREFRVVRYDHLGHGASDVPSGPYTIERLAAELATLLDKLGIERAHHAGASLGGMVALQFAAAFPDRVDRLAVVGSSAHMPPPDAWQQRADAARTAGVGSIADLVVARWFTGTAPSELVQATRAQLAATPAEGYAACSEAIRDMDLRPLLGQITAPTLAIAGSDDPATPVEHAQVIAGGIRAGGGQASVAMIDGAAHLAAVERPGAVADALLRHFLKDFRSLEENRSDKAGEI
jgi:3-oxoadipate enol-lactonase